MLSCRPPLPVCLTCNPIILGKLTGPAAAHPENARLRPSWASPSPALLGRRRLPPLAGCGRSCTVPHRSGARQVRWPLCRRAPAVRDAGQGPQMRGTA